MRQRTLRALQRKSVRISAPLVAAVALVLVTSLPALAGKPSPKPSPTPTASPTPTTKTTTMTAPFTSPLASNSGTACEGPETWKDLYTCRASSTADASGALAASASVDSGAFGTVRQPDWTWAWSRAGASVTSSHSLSGPAKSLRYRVTVRIDEVMKREMGLTGPKTIHGEIWTTIQRQGCECQYYCHVHKNRA